MRAIQLHTHCLAQYLYMRLQQLRHHNGGALVHVYGEHDCDHMERQGPILSMSLTRASGDYIGFVQVERLAALHNIQLRVGFVSWMLIVCTRVCVS
jgi:molybdenum cofactor sulfurtransferase